MIHGIKISKSDEGEISNPCSSKTDWQSMLIRNLLNSRLSADIFPHPVSHLQLIETHISWVILTGCYAYKIKKQIDFGFVDFSNLEKRLFYCQEELRINRRYASDLYIDVVAITGSIDRPHIGQTDTLHTEANDMTSALEYAVKMSEFSQSCLLAHCLARGEVHQSYLDSLAISLCDFHRDAQDSETTPFKGTPPYGSYQSIEEPALDNFVQIHLLDHPSPEDTQLNHLQNWTEERLLLLKPLFRQRKEQGFIRECHGDLHLRNIAMIEGKLTLFDGIEFNDQFRWIDVQSELAYLQMDLEDNGYFEEANRFLNQVIERSGDYSGLRLLPFYKLYRALVRAKVQILRLNQENLNRTEHDLCESEFKQYLDLAERYTSTGSGFLAITHGLSGSGKTTLSMDLVEQRTGDHCPVIRIRSDIERKRLYGLNADSDSHSKLGQGIYSAEATQATFSHIAKKTAMLLENGYSVIVDATFLQQPLRDQFRTLANVQGVAFAILHCEANLEVLLERIGRRKNQSIDASEADRSVLEKQRLQQDELSEEEKPFIFPLNSDTAFSFDRFSKFLGRQKQ